MESLQSFMNIVQNLNKPYYIVLGNHDAYETGGIAKEDFIKFIHQYNPVNNNRFITRQELQEMFARNARY